MTATPAAAQAEREPLLARALAAAGERHLQALAALTALGGALRFSTLGLQSFWFDETTTAGLLRMSLGGMLRTIPKLEATPPLYYVLAWCWARVFGFDEAGIRSLSALAGTATVPVVYLAARTLATRRVGLIAAALTATSPLLIWYSQEARAYALLALLSTCSFLLFLRALEQPRRGRVAAWAAVSILALATHYFSVFVVAPEAVWLALRMRRRLALPALGALVAAGVPLLALAIRQRDLGYTAWIGAEPFGTRVRDALEVFAVGGLQGTPLRRLWYVSAVVLLAAGVVLLVRAGRADRRRAAVALGVGAAAIATPVVLAGLGLDYVLARNLIGAWPLLAIGFACGVGAARSGRLGLALAAAACALSAGAYALVETHPSLQRPDWRSVAGALGPSAERRALLTDPFPQTVALSYYRPDLKRFPRSGRVTVQELDVVGPFRDRDRLPPRLFGLRRIELATRQRIMVARYRSATPVVLSSARLERVLQGGEAKPWAAVLAPSGSR